MHRRPSGETSASAGQGLSTVLGAEPHRVSVSFGRTTQNSFPSGSARTVQDSVPVWPMSTRRAPSARRRSISWSRSAALLVRSRCTRFLTVLGSVTGIKHMPTGAFSSVPMTISFSRSERTSQPSACVQNAPGQADRERQRRCGGVGEAYRQYARSAGRHLATPTLQSRVARRVPYAGAADCSWQPGLVYFLTLLERLCGDNRSLALAAQVGQPPPR